VPLLSTRHHAIIPATILAIALTACGGPSATHLFDGQSLEGWEHVGKGGFTIEDGALKTVGGMGLLWHTLEKLGDTTIRIVYRGERPNSNAGVFIRIPEKPKDPWFPVHFGYEVQIQDESDKLHRTGSLYSLSTAETFPPSPDGWNTMEITLAGQTTTVTVNGTQVNVFEGSQSVPPRVKWFEPRRGPRPDAGYIGLQNHDKESTVWFREVSVLR
jgi:hypothetical protein